MTTRLLPLFAALAMTACATAHPVSSRVDADEAQVRDLVFHPGPQAVALNDLVLRENRLDDGAARFLPAPAAIPGYRVAYADPRGSMLGSTLGYTPAGPGEAQAGTDKSNFPVKGYDSCRVNATVTTGAELKCSTLTGVRVRIIKNCSTATVDLGPSAVATGTGWQFVPGEVLEVRPAYDNSTNNGATPFGARVYGVTSGGNASMCIQEFN